MVREGSPRHLATVTAAVRLFVCPGVCTTTHLPSQQRAPGEQRAGSEAQEPPEMAEREEGAREQEEESCSAGATATTEELWGEQWRWAEVGEEQQEWPGGQ